MKVLILGAGASRAAGYPLASELMDVIQNDALQAKNMQLSRVWDQLLSIKKAAPEALRIFLEHKNPEIIFSLLDLCKACLNDSQRFRSDQNSSALSAALSGDEIPEEVFLSTAYWWIDKAGALPSSLIRSVEEYFAYKQNSDLDFGTSRKYLRDLFGALSKGDVVITLNWDAAADRSLFEINRWSPCDGYGFAKTLVPKFAFDPPSLPRRLTDPSEITLLKLHGSVGWRSRNDHHLSFNGDFLQRLLSGDVAQLIVDDDEDSFWEGPVIAHPSYLKTVRNRFLLKIWERADAAIRSAKVVQVYGYSLPESDVAMSLLLAPLRWRAAVNEVKVEVNDPNGEVLDRYRTFFDGKVTLCKRALG